MRIDVGGQKGEAIMTREADFDIYALDKAEMWEEDETLLEEYIDTLITRFAESPEGTELQKQGWDIGFWIWALVHYGYIYQGVTLPEMDAFDVEDLFFDVFPRKVTVESKESARQAIPELIAFWKYLGREYNLPNAKNIIAYLGRLNPEEFVDAMYDFRRFGPAKALAMAAIEAGVDLSDEAQLNAFVLEYNRRILEQGGLFSDIDDSGEDRDRASMFKRTRRASKEKKKKRKAEKRARRKNRRRKR